MAESFLVLAPRGRDFAIIQEVLGRNGIVCRPCADLAALRTSLDGDAGGVLLTEESLATAGLEALLAWIEAQAPWSDLPFVVLATRQIGHRSRSAARVIERLGNVVLLERPINAETLQSAAQAALRARRRQYQTRGLLQERERREAELNRLNETLEQRVAERTLALEEASETLAFALESASLGSWDLDLRNDTSRRSPVLDRIFGYASPPAAWGRRDFLKAVIAEDRDAVAANFERALQTGVLEFTGRINRQDGAVRWIAVNGRLEYDAQGEPVRMAGIVMDITERRRTEDALHQAQKMEAIGQLTGGVAHDFNNLLTVIVGALDMIIRKPERSDRVMRLAEAAMTAAGRGEQLTQQLLAFSRRQMLRPETLDPGQLLRGFEALARRAVGEAVALDFVLSEPVHPILVDPAQFESAILNLIVNARDALAASQSEKRQITITCANDPSTDGVLVTVADTGIGFDARTLARAFEPFFTTKEVGKGSGLGLSQVYGFMRSAGGEASIVSQPGQGTEIRLSFPRSAESPAAVPQPELAPPLDQGRGAETVLLVEDDEQVRGMAIESLEELRYTVLVAQDGVEALARLRVPGRIDVLFSDVVMPGGLNGVQLAAEAKRLRPDLKVLLTSGYVGDGGEAQFVGLDLPVLTKPYRRDELARSLRVVLDTASASTGLCSG